MVMVIDYYSREHNDYISWMIISSGKKSLQVYLIISYYNQCLIVVCVFPPMGGSKGLYQVDTHSLAASLFFFLLPLPLIIFQFSV